MSSKLYKKIFTFSLKKITSFFCIENVAEQLGKTGTEVFNLLNKHELLQNYIFPSYEALHTQSKQYIVNEIISVLKEGRANADIVCEKTGIAIGSVNSALLILELKGEIIKSAGGYYELNTKF